MQHFKTGQLVIVTLNGLAYTEDGFATGGNRNGVDGLLIFEEIDINSYPSWNDFKGQSTLVQHGDPAAICSFVGRPSRVRNDPPWFYYDIYEILIRGTVRQIFRQNLSSAWVKD